MGFIRRVFDFLAHPTHSRTMGLVVVLLLVVAVSITVYVAQQQQQLKQRAGSACDNISSISDCSNLGATPGSNCTLKDTQCKIGLVIYECK